MKLIFHVERMGFWGILRYGRIIVFVSIYAITSGYVATSPEAFLIRWFTGQPAGDY